MSEDAEILKILKGRISALEAMHTQLVWAWSMTQTHTPSALSAYLQPLEEQAAKELQSGEMEREVAEAFANSIRGLGKMLEIALQQEALERATPTDQDPN